MKASLFCENKSIKSLKHTDKQTEEMLNVKDTKVCALKREWYFFKNSNVMTSIKLTDPDVLTRLH